MNQQKENNDMLQKNNTYSSLDHANLMYCTENFSFVKWNQSFHPHHGILGRQNKLSCIKTYISMCECVCACARMSIYIDIYN